MEKSHVVLVCVTLLALLSLVVDGFNLDVVNYVKQEGPSDSMFGFSVAMHKEAQRSW